MHSKPPSIGPPPSPCIDESVPVSAIEPSAARAVARAGVGFRSVGRRAVRARAAVRIRAAAASEDERADPRKVKSLFHDVSYFLF